MTDERGFPLVSAPEEIDDLVARARLSGRVGLDTEFMREKTYRPRLCLMQIATGDDVFLIDPLTESDLAPAVALIADRDVQIVVHAGRQDLELFYEQFRTLPRNVFDIQMAAGFAGYGASLAYGRLIEAALGVSLEKGESYSDWCRRPLTGAQLRYAADDVRYLVAAADRIVTQLEDQGRLGWALEEMKMFERDETYAVEPEEMWRRVGGRGTLSPRHTAVLKELARWREETASRRDIPRGWVVKDPTLIELARRTPRSVRALKDIRGLNPREAERSGRDILAAIERGRSAPVVEKVAAPSRSAQARARMLSGLADALVRARCEAAGIATELVATRGELESLLAAFHAGSLEENSHRLLQGWRRTLAGDAILGLAAGKIAVKAIDRPPYVQEVVLDGE
ncbi:MAG: ribonuclease D [Actinomycetota bacterium]|nr:ribonuclease D [Actinomycetota bacterium]